MGCCGSSDAAAPAAANSRQKLYADQQQQKDKTDEKENNNKKKSTNDEKPQNANNKTKENQKDDLENGSNSTSISTKQRQSALPKVAHDSLLVEGSSLNKSSSIAVAGSAFGRNTMKSTMRHKCSDYLPGMQGDFICDAFCQQRNPEDGGTVWGGGEAIPIELVPFREQMKDNKHEATNAAFKALMNSEDEKKVPVKKVYAAASCICRAALHAGAISNEPDEHGEQKPQSFSVIALARKPEDAAVMKAPLNDYESRDRYVKHVGAVSTLPELQGALLVKKEWPEVAICGSVSEESGVESYDVNNMVSQWVCFV